MKLDRGLTIAVICAVTLIANIAVTFSPRSPRNDVATLAETRGYACGFTAGQLFSMKLLPQLYDMSQVPPELTYCVEVRKRAAIAGFIGASLEEDK